MTPEERIELMLEMKSLETRQKGKGSVVGSDGWFYYEASIQDAKIKLGELSEYTDGLKEYHAKRRRQAGWGNVDPSAVDSQLVRDQAMGQSMFGMLAPSGVKLATGDLLKAGETRITDNSEIVVSEHATWYDSVVSVERAKRAPTIKVVYDHLGQEMGEVWKAIEEASAAYRQTAWTHNPKLLHDMKENLDKRDVADLNQAITNAALGLGVPPLTDVDKVQLDMARKAGDTTAVLASVRQEWISEHADEIESAVRTASEAPEEQSLEELFNIAYWMGCEMEMIDDQVDSPDTTGQGEDDDDDSDSDSDSTDSGGDDGSGSGDEGQQEDQDSENSGEDSEEPGEDESDGQTNESSDQPSDQPSDQDSGDTDGETSSSEGGSGNDGAETQDESGDSESSQGSSGGQDDSEDDQEGSSQTQTHGQEGTLGEGSDRPDGQQLLDAMKDAIADVEQVKTNESDSFNAVHPYERWIVIDGKTHDMKPHTNVKLAMDDFAGNEEYKEAHFGDPDPDLLHELRLGNMDVFEIEAETQGRIVVVVDCSSSMDCWCDRGHMPYSYSSPDRADNGWLAWQAATAIHRQFPEAEVFGYSSGGGSGATKTIGGRGKRATAATRGFPVTEVSPDWTNGAPDKGAEYLPGGKTHSSYGQQRMDQYWAEASSGHATRIVPIKTPGQRPTCNAHEQNGLMHGGTPEAGALSYLVKRLDAAFETSVGILITDGEPNNSARSYAMTRRMHKAGMRFGVISINYTDAGIYPASMLHHIDKPSDLKKLAAIFEFITGGSK